MCLWSAVVSSNEADARHLVGWLPACTASIWAPVLSFCEGVCVQSLLGTNQSRVCTCDLSFMQSHLTVRSYDKFISLSEFGLYNICPTYLFFPECSAEMKLLCLLKGTWQLIGIDGDVARVKLRAILNENLNDWSGGSPHTDHLKLMEWFRSRRCPPRATILQFLDACSSQMNGSLPVLYRAEWRTNEGIQPFDLCVLESGWSWGLDLGKPLV